MSFSVPDAPAQARLRALAAHTRKWSPKINLVAQSTLADVEARHVQDCVQLAQFLPNRSAAIMDLGCGGGFPGLALACLGYTNLTLVDSDRRKISACRAFLRDQGLSATLIAERIEALHVSGFAVVTARALAPLERLLRWSAPLLAPGGRGLFLKGAQVDSEIAAAQGVADFCYRKHPSLLSGGGCVLEVRHVQIRP